MIECRIGGDEFSLVTISKADQSYERPLAAIPVTNGD